MMVAVTHPFGPEDRPLLKAIITAARETQTPSTAELSLTCPLNTTPLKKHTFPSFAHTCACELQHIGRRQRTDDEWAEHFRQAHPETHDLLTLSRRLAATQHGELEQKDLPSLLGVPWVKPTVPAGPCPLDEVRCGELQGVAETDINLLRQGVPVIRQHHILRHHLQVAVSMLHAMPAEPHTKSQSCMQESF